MRGGSGPITLTLLAALAAGSVLAQEAPAPADLFLGAKLGMSKAQFVGLPAMKQKPPRCLRFDLQANPRARDIQTCDLPPDDEGFARRYMFAPDLAGEGARLIAISLIGRREFGPTALERLSARWGKPGGTTELRESGGRIHVWTLGAQQMVLRYPCSAREDLCLEYSDRPFARQAARTAAGLLGPPGERY